MFSISPDDYICARHRYFYGLDYQICKSCCHHPECLKKNQKFNEKSVRQASFRLHVLIEETFGYFLLGGYLCSKHRSQPTSGAMSIEPEAFHEPWDAEHNISDCDTDNDPVYETSLSVLESVMQASSVSPLKYNCTNLPSWSESGKRNRQYGKKKFRDFMKRQEQLFAAVLLYWREKLRKLPQYSIQILNQIFTSTPTVSMIR